MDGIYCVGLGLNWMRLDGIGVERKCLDGIDGANFHGFSGKPQLREQVPTKMHFLIFLCSEVKSENHYI